MKIVITDMPANLNMEVRGELWELDKLTDIEYVTCIIETEISTYDNKSAVYRLVFNNLLGKYLDR